MSVSKTGSSCLERKWEKQNYGTNVCERKNRVTYSDLVIVTLVLHVFIKLFLGVKLNPTHFQFLPYLQHKTKPLYSIDCTQY